MKPSTESVEGLSSIDCLAAPENLKGSIASVGRPNDAGSLELTTIKSNSSPSRTIVDKDNDPTRTLAGVIVINVASHDSFGIDPGGAGLEDSKKPGPDRDEAKGPHQASEVEVEEDDDEEEPPLHSRSTCRGRLRHWYWRQRHYVKDAKELGRIALPVTAGSLCWNVLSLVNLVFVGHMGENELAAAAMAILFCNITGNALLVGFVTSLETLASQAYGAGNLKRVGLLAQSVMLASTPIIVAIAILWLNAESLLAACGISDKIASLAAPYINIMIPSLPINTLSNVIQKYLSSQGNTVPSMIATIAGVVTSIPLNVLFIYGFGMGYLGTAYTTLITYAIMLVVIVAYLLYTKFYVPTWPGFTWEARKELCAVLRLGIPGIGMTCAEWCGIEVHALLAGMLGTSPLGAQSLLSNLVYMLFMIPLGLGIATNARVGAALGANKPLKAQLAMRTAVIVMVTLESLLVGIFSLLRPYVGRAFTDSENVLAIFQQCYFLFLFAAYFDGIQGTMAGALRACGKQKIGLVTNLCAYWALALPLGYSLAFHVGKRPDYDEQGKVDGQGPDYIPYTKGMGLLGQWFGLMAASMTVAIVYSLYLSRLNWSELAQTISERERLATEQALAEEEAKKKAAADAAAAAGLDAVDGSGDVDVEGAERDSDDVEAGQKLPGGLAGADVLAGSTSGDHEEHMAYRGFGKHRAALNGTDSTLEHESDKDDAVVIRNGLL